MSGKLLVIEGIDSSGKKTQAKKLVQTLRDNNKKTKYVNFPKYDSTFGSIVGDYLSGKFGDKKDIAPEVRKLLFAMDRYQFKETYKKYLNEGGYIVANRYTESNIGFISKEFDDDEEKERFIDWIREVERRLPSADYVFFMDVSPKIAYQLHEYKGERKYMGSDDRDLHERDLELQQSAYDTYSEICDKRDDWIRIDCTNGEEIKSINSIHRQIIKALEDILNLELQN